MPDFPFNLFFRLRRPLNEEIEKCQEKISNLQVEIRKLEKVHKERETELQEKFNEIVILKREISRSNNKFLLFKSIFPSLVQYSNSTRISEFSRDKLEILIMEFLTKGFD